MSSSPFIPGFQLVLASQSPRRSELLRLAGYPFSTRPSLIPESVLPGESAREYVSRLAAEKATATHRRDHEGILAADTTVVVSNTILEKPQGEEQARAMLHLLSGKHHSVLTAICFLWKEKQWLHIEETTVHFSSLSAQEIEAYVQSGEPFDKAGGYGIQGLASKFIPRIEGCFFNVMGLPIHQVHVIFGKAAVFA